METISRDGVEQLKRNRIIGLVNRWPGLIVGTRKAGDAWEVLSPSDKGTLTQYAEQLAKYLAKPGTRGDRAMYARWNAISAVRGNDLPPGLIALACLYVGSQSPIAVNGGHSPLAALSSTSRSFNDDRKETATQWLAWAIQTLEAGRLLTGCGVERLPSEDHPVDCLVAILHAASVPIEGLEWTDALHVLTSEQGQDLGRFALQLLESGTFAGVEIAREMLHDLACFVPDALRGLHPQLVEFPEVWQHGVMFYKADIQTSELLLKRVATTTDIVGLVSAMAWTADMGAVHQFHVWRAAGTTFPGLHVRPEAYSYEAGWELTGDGERRQLYFDKTFRLVPPEEESSSGPVEVATPSKVACGHCGRRLTNLLDLDLKAPELAFLKLGGTRLVIPACSTCWNWTYARLDTNGNAAWMAESTRSEMATEEFVVWPPNRLVLGSVARTPIEPLATWGSYLGGHPNWIGDAEYPRCPRCQHSMKIISHVSLGELNGDGMAYAFLCCNCLISATMLRCT